MQIPVQFDISEQDDGNISDSDFSILQESENENWEIIQGQNHRSFEENNQKPNDFPDLGLQSLFEFKSDIINHKTEKEFKEFSEQQIIKQNLQPSIGIPLTKRTIKNIYEKENVIVKEKKLDEEQTILILEQFGRSVVKQIVFIIVIIFLWAIIPKILSKMQVQQVIPI